MQAIRIGLVLDMRTDVLGIKANEHIVPTRRFRTQFGASERSIDGILGIYKRDTASCYTQPFHA